MKNPLKITAKDEQGSIKLLLKIALPLIITTSSQSIMQFVDRMFLAWYSADTLAACLPAGLMSFALISFFMGTCGYTSVFVATYYGQKRYARLSVALWQGVILGAISGLIIAALTPVGSYIIMSSNHDSAIKVLEREYFTILCLFGGFAVINNALAGFFTGQGKTAITMVVNLIGNIINVVLNYGLIFGKWGLPELGIRGAAWSTIIGSLCVSAMFLSIIFSPKINKKFKIGQLFGFNKEAALRLIKYGIPNGFGFFVDIFSFSVFAFFTGNIDKISLAASNIVLTLQSISFMPMLGLAISAQILMGQYVGRKQPEYGIKSTYNALKLGAGYLIFIVFTFLVFSDFWLGMFAGKDVGAQMAAIIKQAKPLLYLLCVFVWGDLIFLCFGDAIRGAGDTKFHMKAMVFCSILLVIGSYIIVDILNLGIMMAWGWIVFYAWITGLIMMWRFLSGRWRNI
ncbi:MAG: MATE family efflux transporter, partial [Campylobacter sp.]|nr:MATE family efflux transporter [Campylobacter sp.]